ncbi:hypothetical protein QFZ28_003995 [Neobacillus niacini]|nr:hypothetical protein [Neobacillus niacini]
MLDLDEKDTYIDTEYEGIRSTVVKYKSLLNVEEID